MEMEGEVHDDNGAGPVIVFQRIENASRNLNEDQPENEDGNPSRDNANNNPPREADDWIDFIAEQLVEWNVSNEDLYGLVALVHTDFNKIVLRRNPLIQPAIMRCFVEWLDFDTMKNLRLSAKIMKTMVDPYFYKRSVFKIKDTTEFYKFIKKSNTENHLIPVKMKRIHFSEDIDLFEVSRVMYRARGNLKELSVMTTATKLRGEFQNIAGILPVMEKLQTFRFNLPRRYLLHQLFRSTPLTNLKTLRFNFENTHPATISGVFHTCTALEYLEVSSEQVKHLGRVTTHGGIDIKRCRPKKNSNSDVQTYKIVRKPKEDKNV